jgi:catechol 2,3-dioxygenase-like lactoylglutathione lyase family enzyme
MTIELNHTIVHSRDRQEGAEFLASLFGLEVGEPMEPFLPVQVGGVTLDYATSPQDPIAPQHYAFLVSEDEFDEIWARIKERGIEFFPGPFPGNEGQINHHDGGRGLYFIDPSGHGMEIITVPYGGW